MNKFFLLVVFFYSPFLCFGQSKLTILWENKQFLFYETQNIKKLPFILENSDLNFIEKLKSTKNIESLKKVTIKKIKDTCKLEGIFHFSKNPTPDDFRNLLINLNLHEFYVNHTKILTKTLISEEEAKKEAMNFEYKDMLFQSYFNDTSRIEYYDFQIYFAKTKLVYMYAKNYPKYLYEGYVAKYTELLDEKTNARELFLQRNKK